MNLSPVCNKSTGECYCNVLLQSARTLFSSDIKDVWDVVQQAKEAKHSGVKEDLTLTNRSNFCNATEVRSVAIKPTLMTVPSLKEALRSRGLSTAGTKEILVKRLEGALAGEG
nr:uncharacterized protein LOC131798777 [Pocillopora verrucosa]